MKRISRAALALLLALGCALAPIASAEDSSEFISGARGFNTALPAMLRTMELSPDGLSAAEAYYALRRDAEATRASGYTTYTSNAGVSVRFARDDDPCRRMLVTVATADRAQMRQHVGPFALFLAAYLGGEAGDEIEALVDWFCYSYPEEAEVDYRGYHFARFIKTSDVGSEEETQFRIERG